MEVFVINNINKGRKHEATHFNVFFTVCDTHLRRSLHVSTITPSSPRILWCQSALWVWISKTCDRIESGFFFFWMYSRSRDKVGAASLAIFQKAWEINEIKGFVPELRILFWDLNSKTLGCAAGGRSADAGGLVLLTLQRKFIIGFGFYFIFFEYMIKMHNLESSLFKVSAGFQHSGTLLTPLHLPASPPGPLTEDHLSVRGRCKGRGLTWDQCARRPDGNRQEQDSFVFLDQLQFSSVTFCLWEPRWSAPVSGCCFGLMSFYDSQHDTCAQREDTRLIVFMFRFVYFSFYSFVCCSIIVHYVRGSHLSPFTDAVIKYLIKQYYF